MIWFASPPVSLPSSWGAQTRGPRAACSPPVYFMRPLHWSYSDYRMRPASVLTNLFNFFILIFFCHGSKTLKKVCYPSSRLFIVSVILLSGNTKVRVSRTRCSVGGNCCQGVGPFPGFSSWRTIHKWFLHGHCSMTVLAPRNYCIEVKNNVKKPR
jgi:hypothetical protein